MVTRCDGAYVPVVFVQSLQEASDLDDAVYARIGTFVEMMRGSDSYVRTRGLDILRVIMALSETKTQSPSGSRGRAGVRISNLPPWLSLLCMVA